MAGHTLCGVALSFKSLSTEACKKHTWDFFGSVSRVQNLRILAVPQWSEIVVEHPDSIRPLITKHHRLKLFLHLETIADRVQVPAGHGVAEGYAFFVVDKLKFGHRNCMTLGYQSISRCIAFYTQ